MSQTTVEQVVGRMLLEPEFRKLVASDMQKALAGFNLTKEEREGFMNIDLKDFDQTVLGLDERVSKSLATN